MMKRLAVALLALVSLCPLSFAADTYVNGYYRSNGTYVQPHYRTRPDSSLFNNYSTKGNVNPYTGQSGYVNPYSSGSGLNNYSGGYSSPLSYPSSSKSRYGW